MTKYGLLFLFLITSSFCTWAQVKESSLENLDIFPTVFTTDNDGITTVSGRTEIESEKEYIHTPIRLKKRSSSSKIKDGTFFSKKLKKNIAYKVYLPEAYSDSVQFPIIYLMHGHGGNEDSWIVENGGNLQNLLDSLIAINRIPPIVAVTLDAGNSWYVNAIEQMESAYIDEFIPLVESVYNIKKERNSRIIAGLSAGGYGALRFSLKYPELFYASILLSPAAYEPEPPLNSSSRKIPVFQRKNVFSPTLWQQYSYTRLIDLTKSDAYPIFYISTGDDDEYNILKVATDLKYFFDDRSIANELHVIDGKHSWDVWRSCFTYDLIRVFEEN